MKLADVVTKYDGNLLSDGEFSCIAFATELEQDGFLTFLEKEKFLPALENRRISCVLITPELAEKVPAHIRGVFTCQRPKALLFEIHNALAKDPAYVGSSRPTSVGTDCKISPLCAIDQYNVVIGDRVTIEPFAVIKGRVTIGNDVIIRNGAVIGCKGFSFSKDSEGNNISVVDTAEIEIQDHVEIFEQAAVSTGIFPWEKTIIGEKTKADTQVFVAHGTHVGKNCLLAAGSCCCGNSRIGDNVWVGVSAVVSNRIKVGDNAKVSLGAIVTKDVPAGETYTGNFAIPHQRFIKNLKESIREDD